MTRAIRGSLLAVVLTLPSLLHAQTGRKLSFGVSGGASLPMSDLANSVEMGFSAAGHVFLKQSRNQKLHMRFDVSYDRWGVAPDAGSNLVDATFASLGFLGNALYSMGGPQSATRPYLLFGGGLYKTKTRVSGTSAGLSYESSDGGIQTGGGVEFYLSGMSTFLEAKYVRVFPSGTAWAYVPITFGVRF